MFEQALRNLLKGYAHGDIFISLLSDDAKSMIEKEEGRLVCHCFDVYENMIKRLTPIIDKEAQELMGNGGLDPEDKASIVKYFHQRIAESTKQERLAANATMRGTLVLKS